jgi:alkylation response protein AidB-like acyl-CoA dehydrogenase
VTTRPADDSPATQLSTAQLSNGQLSNGQQASTDRPTVGSVRAEVDAWIDENWSLDLTVREWWARLAAAGYTSPTLPVEAGGRGWTGDLAAAALATLARRRVLGAPGGLGLLLAAPTIATHGMPEQVARYVPRILDGTEGWCQLFSEPQAGSDLAGLQTRAERDGDEWVVTGQKVWTSTAQVADLGMLIARTDPDAPKHRGITYFLIDMRQPGIEIHPLKEMTGRAVFNEVFLDEARVPHANILGELNDGWKVANSTLAFERSGIGHGGSSFAAANPGSIAGHLDRPVSDFLNRKGAITGGAVGKRNINALFELARAKGRADDPVVRQALAQVWTYYELVRMMGWKAKNLPGMRTGGEGNLAKIHNTRTVDACRDAANLLLGPEGQLWESPGAAGAFQEMTLFSPAPPIYGGTDQIQRNVLGERVLGLPKEPGPAADTPFRDLPKN